VTHARKAAGFVADGFFDRTEVLVINLIGGVKMTRMRAERDGRFLKRALMEPGGFNPMIVDAVDMDCATRTATSESSFWLDSRDAHHCELALAHIIFLPLRCQYSIVVLAGNVKATSTRRHRIQ
jgi:hypothetical protein